MNRVQEWIKFSIAVYRHIKDYTIPQYGDVPDDLLSNVGAHYCILQVGKYCLRYGKNQRPGQEMADLLKAAHYLCVAYFKLKRDGQGHGIHNR